MQSELTPADDVPTKAAPAAPPMTEPAPAAPELTQAAPFVPDPSLDGLPARAVEPFAPPSGAWRRVSPKLATVKRISASIWLAALFVPATVVAFLAVGETDGPVWIPWVILGAGLLWWVWLFFRARRFVDAMGWARRDRDLCFVSGLMFRNLEVVPFGRMQVAKVSSGPLQRAFGLSTVELSTASALANVTIPGLPADEAKALRDLIIELSDAEGSGL